MKKFTFQMLCLLTLAISYVVVFTTGRSQAAAPVMHSFPGVTTFVTPAGRVGFFEQGTGKIFIYDNNLTECVYIGQMSALGDPVEKLK
jgi:hypothetical protein